MPNEGQPNHRTAPECSPTITRYIGNIGGIGGLAPVRRGDLARLGLRSMFGGLLACYITACVASLMT